MSQLTNEQINYIATEVANRFKTAQSGEQKNSTSNSSIPKYRGSGSGIFNDLDSAVKATKRAHQQLMQLSLEKRKEIIGNIRKKMLLHAEDLAARAHVETGLGRKEDKILKNQLVTKKPRGLSFLHLRLNREIGD